MPRISLLLLLLGAIVSLVAASCELHSLEPLNFKGHHIANQDRSPKAAPTFCKCTCFKNSTIISLGPKEESPSRYLRRSSIFNAEPEPHLPVIGRDDDNKSPRDTHTQGTLPPRQLHPRSKSKSCSECTKAFCLSQGIDFCKNAQEEDVSTLCFQRDSNKDKIIVWSFLACTIGLLGWTAFKRVSAWRQTNPIGGGQTASYGRMPGNFR
ncbi:hypothetical protein BGZ63DRAFT_421834 [Mariannaea sp. PMI_226]|nr:hypothetical protein BGZ63DRAFT_421834 [Mariannaea sp. PMI_226]